MYLGKEGLMSQSTAFNCKYITKKGTSETKVILAENELRAQDMIRGMGATPISITKESGKSDTKRGITLFAKKVKSSDLSLFCRQLHTMLFAGMPLVRALEVMAEQLTHPELKRATEEMTLGVQKGNMFSEVMKQHPKVFPHLLISMVETGELTGKQDEVLGKMAIHYQKDDRIERKIKSAMIYPKFLAALTITVVVIMLVKILPTFVTLFDGTGVDMPALTQFIIDLSHLIVTYWYIIIAVIAGAVFATKAILKTESGRYTYDSTLFKLPIIGPAVTKVITSRFTRTLSTLLSSGLPLLKSLEMAAKVTRNKIVEEGISRVTEDIKKGSKLSGLIKKMGLFPPMLVSMISIGEEAGSLEDMLERTSDFYDEELESAMDSLVGLIEPVMILIMGIIVGIIVVAMLLPTFEVINTVK